MNVQLDAETNQRYRDLAEGKTPKVKDTDILWITPKLLGVLFGVGLVMSFLFNGA